MDKKVPLLYNALLLTGVNLLLRFVSTSFQVYLSGKIGAAGMGLLQMVLSVGGLAITIGMAGIRTATMYLCAEVIGQKKADRMVGVLSNCIIYSLTISIPTAFLLYKFAPQIAAKWIMDTDVTDAIHLLAIFLPINCLCGVMIGHFTGINRIGTLTLVEIVEQIISISTTVLLLTFWAVENTSRACTAVIMGGGIGACFTLIALLVVKGRDIGNVYKSFSCKKKLLHTAIPLAIADNLKAGISTTENLMVPKRLALSSGNIAPLAAFGIVCGMVFPVLMFPAAILFGLAELLIPELARCNAAGSRSRILHLTERSLLLALIYGSFCGGILFLCADNLCIKLYNTPEAGTYLRWYAVLAPMLYCDAIVDAMTKGLGQQKICVRNNIITSALDVILLYVLLPKYGMYGYYISFSITHLLNFILSIQLLRKQVGKLVRISNGLLILLSAACALGAGYLLPKGIAAYCGFLTVFTAMLILFGVVGKQDLHWIQGLVKNKP